MRRTSLGLSIVLSALSFSVSALSQESSDSSSKWYVATSASLDSGTSPSLRLFSENVALRSGWSCSIRPGMVADSRLVRCVKASDVLEFSVQCDANRPRDHLQVRLRNERDQTHDFIEVGCRRT